jgi:hypothetical protein
MESLIHRTPSVGSLIKKIMAINPDLSAPQMIDIIRQSTRPQGGTGNEFASAEVIDEAKALLLARQSTH